MSSTQAGAYSRARWAALLGGPLLFLLVWLSADPVPGRPEAAAMAAVIAWVALWWFTEPVDLAVTSLLPFLLLPLLGISEPGDVAGQYMDPIIFLYLGGFMLAFAMERWDLHRRVALGILSRTGSAPGRILAGVMAATFLISMWVSNTATALMLIPAVMAVIAQVAEPGREGSDRLAVALLLGLAYAATLGGMATLVGTPPNMYFYSYYQRTFPEDTSLHFASFLLEAGIPALLIALLTFLVIRRLHLRNLPSVSGGGWSAQAYRELGPMNRDQKVVASVFLLTVLGWFFRQDMTIGELHIPGWASLTGLGNRVHDGMVAIAAALLLFVLPASGGQGSLLRWKDAEKLPYGIVLLFGSGFALAAGFEASGLSDRLAEHLSGLKDIHPFVLLLVLGAIVTLISEFASNIACVQLVLPVMYALSQDTGLPARGLLVATALFASLGFMMPVATPPNTIVFGTGRLRTRDMVRTGFLVNLLGILLISLFTWLRYGAS